MSEPSGIVTFLFTDVVGSSTLWARDPDRARVAVAQQALAIRGAVEEHGGRVVKELGDGVMAAFPEPSPAVLAAVDAQRALIDQEGAAGITVRMGLHTGESFLANGDYLGTAPNTAARVEAAAHARQILLSGDTWDHVDHTGGLGGHDFGFHYLRGLPDRVRLVQVLAEGLPDECPVPRTESRPDRPSIAVLPFASTGAQEHREFADGLVEDLVIGLSRCQDLYVIARNSTLPYAGSELDPGTIAARLGVRYLLLGSVRWAGSRVRIAVQIVDGVTGSTLWAQQYDRDGSDAFSVFDEITADVVAHLSGYHGVLVLAEKHRTVAQDPGSLDDYETYMRALELKHHFDPVANEESRRLLASVLDRRPAFARAHVAIAWSWLFEVWWGWTPTPAESLARAWECAQRAIELDPLDAELHWLLGELYMVERKYPQVESSYRRAIELNPSLADVRANWASTANRLGLHAEAVESMEMAMRLNPNFPVWYLWFKGSALYGIGDYEGARAALLECPAHTVVSTLYLAAVEERLGRHDRAAESVRQAREMLPGMSAALFAEFEGYRDEAEQAELAATLSAAGLPSS